MHGGAPAISVYPGVYQPAIGTLQSQHPCGLQPDFCEQLQNIDWGCVGPMSRRQP
jgi:hypothetical protein